MTQNIETIQLKRGASTDVAAASLERGEPAVALNTKELWIGDGTGKIKIGDTYFYNSLANLPDPGEEDKLYITKDTGSFYIWDPNTLSYKKYELDIDTSLVYCRARGTVQVTAPSSYQNLNLPSTDVESEPTVVQHDISNQARINILQSGYYRLAYSIVYDIPLVSSPQSDVNATINSRIMVNDSNPLLASNNENTYNLYYVNRLITDTLTSDTIDYFNAGDYVTLQIQGAGDPIYAKQYDLEVFKLDFVKGDAGTPGTPGSIWHNGSGIPLLTLGDNNDYYLDTVTGDTYQKISDAWNLVGNIKGVAGDPGDVTLVNLVAARRTVVFSPSTSYQNVTFDTTDAETDNTVLEHDTTNTDRINILEDGWYEVTYYFQSKPSSGFTDVFAQVIIDDTTVIPQSQTHANIYQNEVQDLKATFPIYLSAASYISLQLQRGATSTVEVQIGLALNIKKLQGVKGIEGPAGPQGPQGEAFVIDEYDDLDEAKLTSIETGSGASPSDVYFFLVVDDNRSNQTLPASLNGDMSRHVIMWDGISWYDIGPFTGIIGPQGPQGEAGGQEEIQYAESESEQQTTNNSFDEKLKLTTSDLSGGTYRIGWYYEWRYSTIQRNFKAQIEIDDTTKIAEQAQEPKDSGTDVYHQASGFKYIILSTGIHTIDLDWCCQNLGDTATIRRARLEIWKVE